MRANHCVTRNISLFACGNISFAVFIHFDYIRFLIDIERKTMYTFENETISILLPHFWDVIVLHLLLNLVLMQMFLAHLAIYTVVYIF